MNFKKCILFFAVILVFSCGRSTEEEELSTRIDSLENEIQELKRANDTLSDHLFKKSYLTRNYPAYFDTISEPEKFILDKLQDHPNLIPKEAVLGGTMRFTSVHFVDDKLVVAEYEDGHILGKSIFRYAMNRDGKLIFSLVGVIE